MQPLIGRDSELEALRRALTGDDAVIALVGPAGSGKSRIAAALEPDLWVSLEGCRQVADVVAATARVLGVRVDTPTPQALLGSLSGTELLVLDGAEHCTAAVQEVSHMWRQRARIVVTSRIRPQAGAAIDIGPLALPGAADLDAVLRSEAGRLFCARAQEVAAGWLPTAAEAPILEALLRKLDGLPLAIQLAAGQVRVLGLQQLLDRVDALRLSSSLASAMQSTWAVLEDDARALLGALAWHAGPFDLDAVHDASPSVDPLPQLSTLIDHSLVWTTTVPRLSGERWYSLYDSVRRFVRTQAPDIDLSRTMAARGYALADGLFGPHYADQLERLAAYRTDLARAFEQTRDAGNAEAAGEAALALDALYRTRGPAAARRTVLRQALALEGPLQDEIWIAALQGRAVPYDAARVAQLSTLEHPRLSSTAARIHARHNLMQGDRVGARRWAERAVEILPTSSRNLCTLGEVLLDSGDAELAVAHMEKALQCARVANNPAEGAGVLGFLATAQLRAAHLDLALATAQEAVAMLQELGDPRRAAITQMMRAEMVLEHGAPEEAQEGFSAARLALEEVGERRWRSYCLAGAAMADALQGRLDPALESLKRALGESLVEEGERAQRLIELWLGIVQGALGDWPAAAQTLTELQGPEGLDSVARGWLAVPAARSDAASTAGLQTWDGGAARPRWCAEVRIAAAWVDRERDRLVYQAPHLLIGPEGDWFEVPGGDRRSMTSRHANRRILNALVQAHARGAGALTVPELFEHGWPGERAVAAAAASRVYTALATLRRWGLRDLIERAEDGYALRSQARIRQL